MAINKGKWTGIAAMVCLTACTSLPEFGKGALYQHSQRLVIHFRSDRLACDAAGIAALAQATGVPMAPIRPMGKAACVVNQFASHPDHFHKQQNRIAAHDSVQWVEPDQRMRAYEGKHR